MMQPCEYPGCRNLGQKHHIVFRSQGGMNISVNYAYLCIVHHTDGRDAVHNNREFDLELKRKMQDRLFRMFQEPEYTIEQISKIIGYDKRRLGKRFKNVKNLAGVYRQEDIIRELMGGRLY